jgi:hypothetical protein
MKYGRKSFVVFGVSVDADRQTLLQVQSSLEWPLLLWDGADGPLAARWRVRALPAVFLLDRHGVVRLASKGMPDPEALERKIDELLREGE